MDADFAEGALLRHAGLTDSNQLEKRKKGDDRLQPGAGVAKYRTEVELWLTDQHLTKLLELVCQRNLFHLHRDRPGRRQSVQHLLEGARQRIEAHLHAGLRDHVGLEQAGEGEAPAGMAAHQRLGELFEALVLFEPPLDSVFPRLQILLLPDLRLRHQGGGLELDQASADHEERGEPIERRTLVFDGAQVVISQAGQGNGPKVDLRALRQRQQQLDRSVEGGRADQVDGIALELGRDLSTQFRPSARCKRRVISDVGLGAWCSATMAASSGAPAARSRSAPMRA